MKKFLFFLIFCVSAMTFSRATEPFVWSKSNQTLTLNVAQNYYLYLHTLKIEAWNSSGKILTLKAPQPVAYQDEFSGNIMIFPAGTHEWTATQNIASAQISFQGCKNGTPESPAVCLMPQQIRLGEVKSTDKTMEDNSNSDFLSSLKVIKKAEGMMNRKEFSAFLDTATPTENPGNNFTSKSFYLALILTLLGGLALNFTPCVLPMIPINLAIIGADGAKSPKSGFGRGLLYGAGMMLAFGILGLAVIFGGAQFGFLNSSSIFNFAVALVFLLLALSMLEVFNIDFSRYQNSISPEKLKTTKNIAAFIMGATAALLGGSCVAPVLIGMLLFASQLYNDGNFTGLILPFVFGLGMALPWPFAGAGLGVLPKPGKWMVRIKQIFSVIIILGAGYYAYVGYTLLPGAFSPETEIQVLKDAMEESKAANKPLLIDFWASWCKNCKYMEKEVFSDPQIKNQLKSYVVVKFQAEKPSSDLIQPILENFDIKGLPAFVICEP